MRKFLVDKQLNRRDAQWWERHSWLDIFIQYRREKLNPTDAPSRLQDYQEEDSIFAINRVDLFKILKSEFIAQKYTGETALLQTTDQLISSHQSIKSEFDRPGSFVLLGNLRKNRVFIAYSELKTATDHDSLYEKTFFTMQTAIKALQEVDPLAKRRRTLLSRSKDVLIRIFDAEKA